MIQYVTMKMGQDILWSLQYFPPFTNSHDIPDWYADPSSATEAQMRSQHKQNQSDGTPKIKHVRVSKYTWTSSTLMPKMLGNLVAELKKVQRMYVCVCSSVGIATRYGLGGPGIESRWGSRFFAPVQTGPGAHPAYSTMGTGSFPGVKRPERGVDHPPLLAPRLRKE